VHLFSEQLFTKSIWKYSSNLILPVTADHTPLAASPVHLHYSQDFALQCKKTAEEWPETKQKISLWPQKTSTNMAILNSRMYLFLSLQKFKSFSHNGPICSLPVYCLKVTFIKSSDFLRKGNRLHLCQSHWYDSSSTTTRITGTRSVCKAKDTQDNNYVHTDWKIFTRC
jgi:hypothetical protein